MCRDRGIRGLFSPGIYRGEVNPPKDSAIEHAILISKGCAVDKERIGAEDIYLGWLLCYGGGGR